MPRVKRQGPVQRRRALTEDERAILVGEGDVADDFFLSDDELGEAWDFARAELLAEWIRTRPGTRPRGWWRFDARGKVRLRLGGAGTPCHEVLAHESFYEKGLPVNWVTPFEVAYYTGKATDVEGRLIGVEFVGHDFAGVAVDPNDPPLFESGPAFLRRLDLLFEGEEVKIPAEDFEPVAVTGGPRGMTRRPCANIATAGAAACGYPASARNT